MRIEGSELIIWLDNEQGDTAPISIDLSPVQLKAIIKMLGLKFDPDFTSYKEYADTFIQRVINGEINPFKLEEEIYNE